MKKVLCMLLMALMIVPLLTGCFQVSAEKVYGLGDNKVSIGVGEKFTVRLPENPTTGYAWAVTISDEKAVKLDKDVYEAKPTDTVVLGSGGQRVLTFKGLAKGTATITMVHERSFEKNSAIQTVVYEVTVK